MVRRCWLVAGRWSRVGGSTIAYIEVPRLQEISIGSDKSTHDNLLDLTLLQPLHVDVDAICRERLSVAVAINGVVGRKAVYLRSGCQSCQTPCLLGRGSGNGRKEW